MPFPYYSRLSARDQAIYRKSDAATSVRLLRPEALWPFVEKLEAELAAAAEEERTNPLAPRGPATKRIEAAAQFLTRGLTTMLEVPAVELQVLAVRPTLRNAELHGLYTRETRKPPRIQLWMRTAQKKRVVAFRTFLRTLLHELAHHLDYELFRLPDSFHTEGFFKRESSLFHQLVPKPPVP